MIGPSSDILTNGPWRYAVYAISIVGVAMAALWCLGALLVSGSMGWSGRSQAKIVATIVLFLIAPLVGSTIFALRAINAAKRRLPFLAFMQAFGCVICAPVARILLSKVLVGS